jgi:hypothetical protein
MRASSLRFCLCIVLAGVAQAQDSLRVRLVGKCTGMGMNYGVAVTGKHACVASVLGLSVVSVADPAHPAVVGRCSTSAEGARGVAASGDYAYVMDFSNALLRVVSVADPTQPVEVGRCSTRGPAYSAAASGDYVYVPDTGGLSVFSVADPAHPVQVGNCGSGEWGAYQVKVAGDYAYVGAMYDGLRVVSVEDPTDPVEVAYMPGYVRALAASDAYVYACFGSSFRVISVADPAHPTEVGRLDLMTSPKEDVTVTHGYAFVATWDWGLRVISVSDPTRPVEVGYYGAGPCWALATDGDYVYLGADALWILQFYQLGDLDVDNDSLDVVGDTLRLSAGDCPRMGTALGTDTGYALGEFVLANTSPSYNPDSIDGPSVSPVDSLGFTGSLTGPGGTIDSIVILNLPASLAQGQTIVCTLAVYAPPEMRNGDYAGSITISSKDTAGLQVYETFYALVRYKLGDLDVDDESLDVVADTLRLRYPASGVRTRESDYAVGEFILANTSESYNPDTADGPSLSPVSSLGFTGSLAGPGGTLDSILIPNLPASLAQGQTAACTLAVHVPPLLQDGDYVGSITITGRDSAGMLVDETFHALIKKTTLGDLDVDNDLLDVARDTMNLHTQPAGPVYSPYAKARFKLVNTSSSYNPDTADGPSRSPLAIAGYDAYFCSARDTVDSIYLLNLPSYLDLGQAVECTLALVLPVGTRLDDYSGLVTINAYDTMGHRVGDSFFLAVHGPEPRQNLDSLRVAPIPFKPHQNPEHDAVHFQGLTDGARVIVYDASGQTVWSATETGDGHVAWDAKVASGIYVYLVVSKGGDSRVGKLSVIR